MEAGKRQSGSAAVNAVGPPQLILCDELSGRNYLIDSGAQVSLLPASTAHKAGVHESSLPNKTLQAANGTPIPSYGTITTHLKFGGRRFAATLVIADVRRPLLGADFLRSHNLLVDICGQRLIDAHTFHTYECAASHAPTPVVVRAVTSGDPYQQLLHQRFPEILKPTFTLSSPAHGVYHHNPTRGPPPCIPKPVVFLLINWP